MSTIASWCMAALSMAEAAPAADWRLHSVAVPGEPALEAAFAAGRDGATPRSSVELVLPASAEPALLTFAWTGPLRSLRDAAWTVDRMGPGPTRRAAAGSIRAGRLAAVEIAPRGEPTTLRLAARGRGVRGLEAIAVHRLGPGVTPDVWLVVGASNQARAFHHAPFAALVRARFGRDPVVLNRAVGASTAASLRRALPGLLAAHPWATTVAIHAGGNDVSTFRPFPGGAQALRRELEAILTIVSANGRKPILARLSYRRYRRPPKSTEGGADDNGAGPYVEAVYDPLIARHCPGARVDLYGWFRDHREELSADGIHPTAAGEASWVRIWAEGAGPVVYGQAGTMNGP